MIEVLPYTPEWLNGVVDVILPIQQEEFHIPITLEKQPDLADIPGFYQKGGGNFWVARIDTQIVGTISLLDIGDGRGALRKMFVKKPFRGKKAGVAKRLLLVLLDWSREKEFQEIFLGTTPLFLAAHRFYEKNGFTLISKTDLPAAFPVMSVDTRFYRMAVERKP